MAAFPTATSTAAIRNGRLRWILAVRSAQIAVIHQHRGEWVKSTQSGPTVSLRKGPVAGEKRSSESEDYASKVRATPLSWLRGRVWVGDVQLA